MLIRHTAPTEEQPLPAEVQQLLPEISRYRSAFPIFIFEKVLVRITGIMDSARKEFILSLRHRAPEDIPGAA